MTTPAKQITTKLSVPAREALDGATALVIGRIGTTKVTQSVVLLAAIAVARTHTDEWLRKVADLQGEKS